MLHVTLLSMAPGDILKTDLRLGRKLHAGYIILENIPGICAPEKSVTINKKVFDKCEWELLPNWYFLYCKYPADHQS